MKSTKHDIITHSTCCSVTHLMMAVFAGTALGCEAPGRLQRALLRTDSLPPQTSEACQKTLDRDIRAAVPMQKSDIWPYM